ncbi:hypothetical protein ZWY2020_050676 [Hordeum vulgare]|nr:hypothetical protein ZWY2020_050676 [Hordeum vulgare]
MKGDPKWSAIEATLIRWFYQTVSKDIFHTVVVEGGDACTVWTKIKALFTDNKLQRLVFLLQEFLGCHQDDSTINDYCMWIKMLADELCDIGAKVSNELMLSTITIDLNKDFGNAASNLTLLTEPTFPVVVAYLKLEERWMKKVKQRVQHTALTADTTHRGPTASAPAPPHPRPPPPPGFFPLPLVPHAAPAPPQPQQQGRRPTRVSNEGTGAPRLLQPWTMGCN